MTLTFPNIRSEVVIEAEDLTCNRAMVLFYTFKQVLEIKTLVNFHDWLKPVTFLVVNTNLAGVSLVLIGVTQNI